MNRILRHPATNMVCISVFTAFYASIFLATSNSAAFRSLLADGQNSGSFFQGWSKFLMNGYHAYIAYGMIAVTALVVVLLLLRRHAYDEYHTSLLMQSLVVASILTLAAIAVLCVVMLLDPVGLIEKFALFIAVHWVTVVHCDLCYVLLCRWK